MGTDTKVTLRMPRKVRDQISDIAEKEHRSMGAQIVVMLERAVEEYFKQRGEPAL